MSKPPGPNHNNLYLSQEVVHFDPVAFDLAIRSNGVIMEHWRAIVCPIGIDDRFDTRSHGDHDGCSNGYIYKYAGDVTVFFSGNSSSSHLEDMGIIDGSTTQITLPRYYDGTDKQVAVQHYDRFFLKEPVAACVTTQKVEAHVTGLDRLQYLATEVEHVIDQNNVEYSPVDYVVEKGRIRWIGKRPAFNATTGKGITYSIRYRYSPFWYVKNIMHEVRVGRVFDMVNKKSMLMRLPYAAQLQREYAFESEERENDGKSTVRDAKGPRSGSFGPR
jgi:hypothetical protein